MAHWLHAAESLYMGNAGQLYSALAENLVEFHLDSRSVLEWRKTCGVSEICFAVMAMGRSARRLQKPSLLVIVQ